MINVLWRMLVGMLVLASIFCTFACDRRRTHFQSPVTPEQLLAYRSFNADRGISDDFGVYKGESFFQVQVPAGEYLLRYFTTRGEFYLVFEAQESAILTIGIDSGDNVKKTLLSQGRVLDRSRPESYGPVILYSEQGAQGSWDALFTEDPNEPSMQMIGGVGADHTPGESLTLYIPDAGDYALSYLTNRGSFERSLSLKKDNTTYLIKLDAGEQVLEAYVLKK